MYIRRCCRVKICPRITFSESIIYPNFHIFPFLFFKNPLLFLQGEWDKKKKKEDTKLPFFESKISPIMLRNIRGQIFNSTLARFLTQSFSHVWPYFPFIKICWNHYFYRVLSKNSIFAARPKKLGTLFVNITALTELFVCPFFCVFGILGFCCVRLFGLFWKEWKQKKLKSDTTQPKKETRPQDANKKPLSLVYKKKKADNTDT